MSELTGIEATWKKFLMLDPAVVCKRAGISFNRKLQTYTVRSFGQDMFIPIKQRRVTSNSPEGKFLLATTDYFFDLSVLWYLITTQDIPLSGRLIKPAEIPGGQIFIKGTHVLPLDAIARRFNNKKEHFLEIGTSYGGSLAAHGDIGLKLFPFPRVPVYIILWFGDSEFPAKGQLLLDSTCSYHLSVDVIWAVTMVCCLVFLQNS